MPIITSHFFTQQDCAEFLFPLERQMYYLLVKKTHQKNIQNESSFFMENLN